MSNRISIDGRRYDLSGMIDLHYSRREQGGVTVRNAWFGPRSGRIIVEYYSIWNRGNGECRGTYYTVYDHTDPVDYLYWWTQLGLDARYECPVVAVRES
jgi:hypothetical protein